MYRSVPHNFLHTDPRGSITGLLNEGEWQELNLITSESGAIRGRHYHKETVECFVILAGRIRVLFRRPDVDGRWEFDEQTFVEGEVFIVQPMVEHTFHILETSIWINLLSKRMDLSKPDFYKYVDIDDQR